MADYFPTCVGQEQVKKRLAFYIDSYKHTGTCPNIMFLSQKGSGKTMLARQVAAVLDLFCVARGEGRKGYVEFSCGSIKKSDDFLRKLMQVISSGHVTIFMDEFHALPRDVADWLLTAIEMGRPSNTVTYQGRTAVWDFSKVTLLVATTERQKVFLPLLNRFREITLSGYKPEELESILMNRVTVPVEQSAAQLLVSLARGNARSVVDIADEVNRYAVQRDIGKYFSMAMAEELVSILDVFPLGLSRAEVNLLTLLLNVEELSLTGFCAVSGLTRPAQQDMETYLLRHGLMEISEQGRRRLSDKGLKYLIDLGLATTQVQGTPLTFLN